MNYSKNLYKLSTISYNASKRNPNLLFNRVTMANLLRNFSSTDLVVEHDPKAQKFIIKLDDDNSAFISYEKLSSDEVLLYHTEVPKQFGGKGIGKILADEAFKHFENNNQKMVLTCTYLQKLDKSRKNKT